MIINIALFFLGSSIYFFLVGFFFEAGRELYYFVKRWYERGD